jgi:hypothetical protein
MQVTESRSEHVHPWVEPQGYSLCKDSIDEAKEDADSLPVGQRK